MPTTSVILKNIQVIIPPVFIASSKLPANKHPRYFYPLEVVSRYRDPQLQVGKNDFKWVEI